MPAGKGLKECRGQTAEGEREIDGPIKLFIGARARDQSMQRVAHKFVRVAKRKLSSGIPSSAALRRQEEDTTARLSVLRSFNTCGPAKIGEIFRGPING
ncbi:hypothetical protein KM043_015380 [Ampulex compressa]|nr:hypothetical protein KM043_015380 [Ampulex compressa]